MKAVFCLDDKNGMTFNKRRQSRDSVLIARVCALLNGETLHLNGYSEPLFKESGASLAVSDGFLETAKENDFCFIENKPVPIEKCKYLYIFRWNRHYPSDMRFEHDPGALGFALISAEEFPGSSHEKITLEIYKKGE